MVGKCISREEGWVYQAIMEKALSLLKAVKLTSSDKGTVSQTMCIQRKGLFQQESRNIRFIGFFLGPEGSFLSPLFDHRHPVGLKQLHTPHDQDQPFLTTLYVFKLYKSHHESVSENHGNFWMGIIFSTLKRHSNQVQFVYLLLQQNPTSSLLINFLSQKSWNLAFPCIPCTVARAQYNLFWAVSNRIRDILHRT